MDTKEAFLLKIQEMQLKQQISVPKTKEHSEYLYFIVITITITLGYHPLLSNFILIRMILFKEA